eukprot:scaffold2820_cov160-Amphora_coffeaeformis.AAC.11
MSGTFFNALGSLLETEDPFDPLPLPEDQVQLAVKKPSIKKPKRPLSAYNLFFQSERGRLLAQLPPRVGRQPKNSHGKLGFKDMATTIGKRWRELDDFSKAPYLQLAKQEKIRYEEAKADYRRRLQQQEENDDTRSSTPPTTTSSPSDFSELARRLGPDMVDWLVATFK